MKNILFLFFLIPIFSFGQTNKIEILTDTSIAVGIVIEDCYVGKSIDSYCFNNLDKHLKSGAVVLISGIKNCKKSYSNDNNKFFEIRNNNETYFIEEEKLLTDETYYSQIENMLPNVADSFRQYAQHLSTILYENDMNKALKFIDGCKVSGLAILDWSFYDESEYTDGTGVKIKVYNPTRKTIKYLWFTFVGFNPVGDKIIDRKRGSNITMKGVGPIKPNESGTYEYSYVWFTDLVETAKLIFVKIQYMDGSIKTITTPKKVMLSNDLYEILFVEE